MGTIMPFTMPTPSSLKAGCTLLPMYRDPSPSTTHPESPPRYDYSSTSTSATQPDRLSVHDVVDAESLAQFQEQVAIEREVGVLERERIQSLIETTRMLTDQTRLRTEHERALTENTRLLVQAKAQSTSSRVYIARSYMKAAAWPLGLVLVV